MNHKKELFKEHLFSLKEGQKIRLSKILSGESFEKFSSRNLQEITNELKEIEILLDFIDGNDFKKIIEKGEKN